MEVKGPKIGTNTALTRTDTAQVPAKAAQAEAATSVQVAHGVDRVFGDVAQAGDAEGGGSKSIGAKIWGAARAVVGAFARKADEATVGAQLDQAVDDLHQDSRLMKLDYVQLAGLKRTAEREIETIKGERDSAATKMKGAKASFDRLTAKGDTAGAAVEKEAGMGFAADVQRADRRLERAQANLGRIEQAMGKAKTAIDIHERQTEAIQADAKDAKLEAKVGDMQRTAASAIDGLDDAGLTAKEAAETLRRRGDEGAARLDLALETGVGRSINYEIQGDKAAAEDLFNKA